MGHKKVEAWARAFGGLRSKLMWESDDRGAFGACVAARRARSVAIEGGGSIGPRRVAHKIPLALRTFLTTMSKKSPVRRDGSMSWTDAMDLSLCVRSEVCQQRHEKLERVALKRRALFLSLG